MIMKKGVILSSPSSVRIFIIGLIITTIQLLISFTFILSFSCGVESRRWLSSSWWFSIVVIALLILVYLIWSILNFYLNLLVVDSILAVIANILTSLVFGIGSVYFQTLWCIILFCTAILMEFLTVIFSVQFMPLASIACTIILIIVWVVTVLAITFSILAIVFRHSTVLHQIFAVFTTLESLLVIPLLVSFLVSSKKQASRSKHWLFLLSVFHILLLLLYYSLLIMFSSTTRRVSMTQ
ncbi:unnamed protein product [Heterobilharzia americana]|nr:unnamed protein product [Heterobilharzia americana]